MRQSQGNEERITALADRIANVANRMHQLTFDRAENNAVLIQVHSSAVTLWNIAVAMKTGGGGQNGTTYNARCKNVYVVSFFGCKDSNNFFLLIQGRSVVF